MSDLIDKRNERTKRRKAVKRKMDSIIGLSFHDKEKNVMTLSANLEKLSDSKARLIDEGYIDNGFVIKKGTLEKYLNGKNEYVKGWEFDGEHYSQTEVLNLNSDFVGTVNLGHFEFAQMPFVLGTWTKEDLALVDIENDRKALDVTLHLDEESVFIKELKRQNHDIGISAEFWVHQNEEDTEKLSETLGYYLPVFDEIYIFAYGLVGECGNVNSSGLELKGEPMKDKEMLEEIIEDERLDDEKEELGVEEVEIPTTEEAPEAEEAEEETEETEEELAIDEAEEAEEEEAEAEEAEEEPEDEEVADEEAEEGDEDGDDEAKESDEEELAIVTELKEQIQTLTNTISELKEANAKLKKSNKRLSAKYQNELDKKEKFKDSLKGLTVELLPDEDKEEKKEEAKVTDRSYYRGDGIGEL